MATDKLFTVAGTSNLDGMTKVRFANDAMRVKVLTKSGHTDIMLVELPEAMTKLAAIEFIQGLDEFAGVAAQAAIADYLDSNTPKAPVKAAVTPKSAPGVTKTKATPQVKALAGMTPLDIKENEDASF